MKAKKYIPADIVAESLPGRFPAGTCLTCVNDYSLCEHRLRDAEREKRQAENIKRVLQGQRIQELSRIALRFELESDEGGTALQKAARILPARNIVER